MTMPGDPHGLFEGPNKQGRTKISKIFSTPTLLEKTTCMAVMSLKPFYLGS